MSEIIYKLPSIFRTSIIPKPTGGNKSPYLIYLNYYINQNNICHSKAQKCCGLLSPDKEVFVSKYISSNKNKAKNKEPLSKFTAQLAIYREDNGKKKDYNNELQPIDTQKNIELIGINPDVAEHIYKNMLIYNNLSHFGIKIVDDSLKSQVTIKNGEYKSRFDFTAINSKNGKIMIIEVKTVVIANYENDTEKIEKFKLKNGVCTTKNFNEKIAIFPKGFRARKTDTISPRAIHHMEHLSYIQRELSDKYETYLVFVIQRSDVNEFQPYKDDPQFIKTLQNTYNDGVKVCAVSIKWNIRGEAIIHNNNVPINYLFNNE